MNSSRLLDSLVLRTLLILCTSLLPLAGQQHPGTAAFSRMSANQGLSNNIVYAIVQDSVGFMWFGTRDGLNRYDGYTFKTFRPHPDQPSSITDRSIRCLMVDDQNRLWVGTESGGINIFDPDTERFAHLVHDADDSSSLSSNQVNILLRSRTGEIYAGTSKGLDVINPQSRTITRLSFDGQVSDKPRLGNIRALAEDDAGNIWVGSLRSGLYRITANRQQVSSFRRDKSRPGSLPRNNVFSVLFDSQGTLWIGTYGGGLCRLDKDSEQFIAAGQGNGPGKSLSDDRIWSIVEADDGYLWLGTFDGGINRLDPATGEVHVYKHDPFRGNSLSGNFIRSLYIDRSGNIWAGSNLAGLSRLDLKPQTIRFHQVLSDSAVRNRAGVINYINTFYELQDGRLLAGGRTGIYDFDVETGQFRPLQLPGVDALSYVYDIAEDRWNRLWIATHGFGLYGYQPASGQVLKYTAGPAGEKGLTNIRLNRLLYDGESQLWVTSHRGVNRLHLDGTGVRSVRQYPEEKEKNALSDQVVGAVEADNRGMLWFSTAGNGVVRTDPFSEEMRVFSQRSDRPQQTLHHRIEALHWRNSNTLWLGTRAGIYSLETEAGTLNRLRTYPDLSESTVFGMQKDSSGHVWVSSSQGIFRIASRADSLIASEIDFRADLYERELVSNAAYRTHSGKILFGARNGVYVVDPAIQFDNRKPPPITLTDLRVLAQPASAAERREIREHKSLTLPYDRNFISFEFAALDFTHPERNRYAYRLEGLETAWNETRERRFATYTDLDPGDYRFVLRAANNDAGWAPQGYALNIEIQPPFWQRWWFRIAMALSVVALLSLIYRARVNKLLELERLRTRIASDLHDDIGASLTKISLYTDMLSTDSAQNKRQDLLQRIGSLSRELMMTMSDIVWSIDARNDTVGNLMNRMKDFAASVLGARHISHQFQADGLPEQHKVPVDVRQNVYLLFKEAINNIARHSDARHVHIVLKREAGGRLNMRISDDGTHSLPESGNGGHGLRNMRMRAQNLDGSLEIRFENGVHVDLKNARI